MTKTITIKVDDETMTDVNSIVFVLVTSHEDKEGSYANVFSGNRRIAEGNTEIHLFGKKNERGLEEALPEVNP